VISFRSKVHTAALGLAGMAALLAPTPAHATVGNYTGVGGFDWDTGYQFAVCDKAADGRAVRALLILNGYTSDILSDYSGNGTCKDTTGREPHQIDHFALERQGWGGISWEESQYFYTGY
jgi:hypothetical protein